MTDCILSSCSTLNVFDLYLLIVGFDLDQIYNNEKLSGSEGSWGGKGDDVFGKPSTQVDEEKKSWWKPW